MHLLFKKCYQRCYERCWQRPWIRYFITRVIVRLVALLGIFLLLKYVIDWKAIIYGYLHAMERLKPWPTLPAIIFMLLMIPFTAFTPGSYAPTVLAGATFPYYVSIPISYIGMNFGAILNFIMIRRCLRPCAVKTCGARMARFGTFETINLIITHHPIRTVILLRLPYLGCGILNYTFSLSPIKFLPMLYGNLIGLVPGTILFAILGGQARSLADVVLKGQRNPDAIITLTLVAFSVIVCVLLLLMLVRKTARQQLREAEAIRQQEQEAEAARQLDAKQQSEDGHAQQQQPEDGDAQQQPEDGQIQQHQEFMSHEHEPNSIPLTKQGDSEVVVFHVENNSSSAQDALTDTTYHT